MCPRFKDSTALLEYDRRLVHRIDGILEERSLTKAKAARILGIAKQDLSELLRGDLDRFPLDRLLRFLNALDLDVEIVVRPKRSGKQVAGTTVVAV